MGEGVQRLPADHCDRPSIQGGRDDKRFGVPLVLADADGAVLKHGVVKAAGYSRPAVGHGGRMYGEGKQQRCEPAQQARKVYFMS